MKTFASIAVAVVFVASYAYADLGAEKTGSKSAPAAKEIAAPAPGKVLAVQLDRQLPDVSFNGVGFGDVIDFLRDVSGASIVIDWKRLEAIKVDRNTAITYLSVGGDRPPKFTVEDKNITISAGDMEKK